MTDSHAARLGALILLVAALWAAPALGSQGPRLFTEVSEREVKLDRQQRQRLDGYRSRPDTADTRLVQVDFDLLQTASIMDMEIFGESIPVFRDSVDLRDEDDYTWRGSDVPQGNRALLVARNGGLTGTFFDGTPSGRRAFPQGYSVRPLGGGLHVVVKPDPMVPAPPEPMPDKAIPDPPDPGGGQPCTTFTMLIAYTPAVAAATADPVGLAQLITDEFNDIFVDSGVNLHVNLVHVYETNYDEYDQVGNGNNAYDQDINLLEDRFTDPSDGHMDEVHTKRDTYGADIAVLLGDTNSPAFDGWSGKVAQVAADEDTAFAVVSLGYATGPYHWVFYHEVGHLFGARHDIDNDSALEPYAFGHGYIHSQGEDKWRTILAKNDEEFCGEWPGCPRIGHYSNPGVDHEGDPTGNALEADNARVFEERACHVAGFRNGPVM
jgi:hypothetical protein